MIEALLAAVSATAQTVPTPAGALPAGEAQLVSFHAGAARCGDAVQRPAVSEEPFPSANVWGGRGAQLEPYRLRFRIDASGRPLGIASLPRRSASSEGPDVLPSFSIWRFEPGAERENCEIEFVARGWTIEDAPPAILERYVALLEPGLPGWSEVVWLQSMDRLGRGAINCDDLALREEDYPSLRGVPQQPGTFSFTFVRFDTDAEGVPRNLRVVTTTGNQALDQVFMSALAELRLAPRERRDCLVFIRRNGSDEPVAAPPVPERIRRSIRSCAGNPDPLQDLPPLNYPLALLQRSIEGWALISYDLSPWGQPGNVAVVQSEPVSQFGDEASRIVARARADPIARGARRCTVMVSFRLPEQERDESGRPRIWDLEGSSSD